MGADSAEMWKKYEVVDQRHGQPPRDAHGRRLIFRMVNCLQGIADVEDFDNGGLRRVLGDFAIRMRKDDASDT